MKYIAIALVGMALSSCGVPFEFTITSDKGSAGIVSDGVRAGGVITVTK